MSERAIFIEALEKGDPAQQAAYLDQACANDRPMRRRIERLLKAHQPADSFLEHRPHDLGETIDPTPIAERPGTIIGPYKLMEQIGEGGMGLVFVAEQQQPVRRAVALKIIKPGMDSAQVIARFEAERQALAMMNHQNIAKVLDAGTTESGRPYFVMELVHGVPITDFCNTHRLTPRQRLGLFVPACHAIQHAHQKGIIHRDIKPSNILVTMYDDKPVPKVIDFGVAKAVEQRLTEKTVYTRFGTLIGTFEYMSPEQAEMNAFGVDTRSDIYSLGVLLYELLTGSTPLEKQRLREAAYGDIVRLIKEEEPPRPSTRLSTSGAALVTISQQRGSAPERLTQIVRGELDWIVMRCLEKDRTRRYETASGLAKDVERYLNDEPVEACPPTVGYRVRKFARKHKNLFAAAASVAAVLLLGVVGSAWQAVRATQAEETALANEHQANANAAQAKQNEKEANKQRDEVKALNEKLERILYAAHINLAQRAWDDADLKRVLTLLDQHRPKGGEPDLRGFEWHYLHRLCNPANVLSVKGAWGDNVAFSPDGKRLFTLNLGGSKVKDGVVVERYDPQLWAFDAWTGKELSVLTLKGGGNQPFLSSNGEYVVLSPDAKTVNVWNVQTGKQVSINRNAGGGPLILSPDGKRLAGRSGRELVVWDSQTGQELRTLKGHADPVLGLAFSQDGKRLASNSGTRDKQDKFVPGEVKVWDVETGKEIVTIKALADPVWTLSFSADGNRLLTASDAEAKMWEVKAGKQLFSLKAQSDAFSAVRLTPDGQRLVTTGHDSSKMPGIVVWDAKTGQMIFGLHGHTSNVFHIAFSQDGKHMATVANDQTARIWDLQTGEEVATLRGIDPRAGGIGMAFSPDGKRMALAGGGPSVPLKVWDWDAQKDRHDVTFKGISILKGIFSGASHVALSPDFKYVAGGAGTTVKVWDAQTGKEITTLKGLKNAIFCVAFSRDGTRVAAGDGFPRMGFGFDAKQKTAPGVVKVWDVQTGKELLSLEGHTDSVIDLAFSVDGKRLASAAVDRTVKVWDAQTGKELLSFDTKRKSAGGFFFGGMSFSPDGKRFAANGGVWDAQTGKELLSIAFPSVSFTPEGNRLVSRSGALKVWDAQTGEQVFPPKGEKGTMVGRQGESYTTAFSPDGKRLAVATTDQVKIYDVQTWQELLSLKAPHASPSSFLAFSPDGHRLGLVTGDGTLTIWDAMPLPAAAAK